MQQSTPFANIAITGVAIVLAFLAAGVALTITGHGDSGGILIGAAVGAAGGTTATTAVVHQSNGFPAPDPPKIP